MLIDYATARESRSVEKCANSWPHDTPHQRASKALLAWNAGDIGFDELGRQLSLAQTDAGRIFSLVNSGNSYKKPRSVIQCKIEGVGREKPKVVADHRAETKYLLEEVYTGAHGFRRFEPGRAKERRRIRTLRDRWPRKRDGAIALPLPSKADLLCGRAPKERWAVNIVWEALQALAAAPTNETRSRLKDRADELIRLAPGYMTRGIVFWVWRHITPQRGGSGRLNPKRMIQVLLSPTELMQRLDDLEAARAIDRWLLHKKVETVRRRKIRANSAELGPPITYGRARATAPGCSERGFFVPADFSSSETEVSQCVDPDESRIPASALVSHGLSARLVTMSSPDAADSAV